MTKKIFKFLKALVVGSIWTVIFVYIAENIMIYLWKTLSKQISLALIGAAFCVISSTPAQADVSSIMIDAQTGDVLSAQRADKLR